MTATAPLPRTLIRVLLVAIVAALMLTVVQTAPASAYTTRKSGAPGRVTVYQVQGSHYDVCPSTYYSCFNPWVVATGPLVGRSPASSGAQRIGVVYNLQRWNGSSWVHQSQQTHVRIMDRGVNRLRMPRIDFLPNSAGHFRVTMVVGWANGRDTRGFGSRVYAFNQAADYTCNTRFPCQVGAGWVWLRSPGV